MNVTYSFFTATAKKQITNATTGTVRIGITNDKIQVNSVDFDEQKIVPGDIISFSARIINQGTSSAHAIMVFAKTIVATESANNQTQTTYYSFDSNGNLTEISTSSGTAFTLAVNGYRDCSISENLKAYEYGNEFQNASLSVTLTVYSIQEANLTPEQATPLLLNKAMGT